MIQEQRGELPFPLMQILLVLVCGYTTQDTRLSLRDVLTSERTPKPNPTTKQRPQKFSVWLLMCLGTNHQQLKVAKQKQQGNSICHHQLLK
jgi:hypothetical protein